MIKFLQQVLIKAPDSKVHGANMGPIWVLSAPDGPLFSPINLSIRGGYFTHVLENISCEVMVLFAKLLHMMTSSNGNVFRITGPLCGELIGHRWIPGTKANDAEVWYFLRSVPEQTV